MTPYWTGVIDDAIVRLRSGEIPFSSEQVAKAVNSWTDCACGNQDARIPRDDYGCPLDLQLARLGEDFAGALLTQRPVLAKTILRRIESRAAFLLPTPGGKVLV